MTAYDRMVLPLEIVIRPCTEADLDNLEWYGLYSLHRAIIRDAFARQQHGDVLMLLAIANGFPVGQAWIDFAAHADEPDVALLWAVRVYPFLQGGGIGGRLLASAERAIAERGCRWAEIGVEKDNPRARRLYERGGYRVHTEALEQFSYIGWKGEEVVVDVDQWMMRKQLHPARTEPRAVVVDARLAKGAG
jgi:ribosomal protein S18 acetylase RimI-like enzyme